MPSATLRPKVPRPSLAIAFAGQIANLLFASAVIAQIVIAWQFWGLTWDDSAITLGFAQTFAHTGRIEPTPGSGIVEGYSTTLWMLLMSLAARVAASPATLLATAKIATLLLNIASLFMMRSWFGSWVGRTTASLIAGVVGCCFMFYETINGMETPLLLFLVMAMLLARTTSARKGRIVYLLLGISLLLVRFEAAWLLIPFLVFETTQRNRVVAAATWISASIVENSIRWWYFGALIPNTITAKRHPPYTSGTAVEQMRHHLSQLHLMFHVSWMFVVVILLYLATRVLRSRELGPARALATLQQPSQEMQFTAMFFLFSVVLTVGIGANWGPPLRSFYPGLPFFVALILVPLADRKLRGNGVFFSTAILMICGICAGHVVHDVILMRTRVGPIYMPGATVENVRRMSDVLHAIQVSTGQRDILYAGSDMGAVQLYSKNVRVLDLGLLCDKTLAREGYAAVGSYVLEQRRPDVIEIHDPWTELTQLGSYATFRRNYRPIVVEGTKIFLRRDLLDRVPLDHLVALTFIDGSMVNVGEVQGNGDRALNRQFGSYLSLR